MPAYGLHITVVGHEVGHKHDVPYVDVETRLSQSPHGLADDRVPRRFDSQNVGDLQYAVGHDLLGVDALHLEDLFQVAPLGDYLPRAARLGEDRPADAIKETARVLKYGGLFLISFPFLYPIHAEPHDYTRFTEYAMSKLLKDHGFEVIEMSRIGGFWYIAGMYLHMYLKTFDRGPLKKIRLVAAVSWVFLWLITQIHRLEGAVMKAAGKNPEELRKKWTVNYTFVARKGAQAA